MIALPLILILSSPQGPKLPEPESFVQMKRLIGGVWRGRVGNTPTEARYTLTGGGRVIESHGIVGDPKKPIMRIHAQMGIDPLTNRVFYLDQHDGTTIYFGHLEMSLKDVVFDFKGLSGDGGNYLIRARFLDNDTFESDFSSVDKDGMDKKLITQTVKRTPK